MPALRIRSPLLQTVRIFRYGCAFRMHATHSRANRAKRSAERLHFLRVSYDDRKRHGAFGTRRRTVSRSGTRFATPRCPAGVRRSFQKIITRDQIFSHANDSHSPGTPLPEEFATHN